MADITFAIRGAFIEPVGAIDPDFLGLMEHLCTFERMGQSVVSAGSYGHKTVSRDVASEVFESIRCRFRSLSQTEIESAMREGEVIDTFFLYVPITIMPKTMREPGQAPLFRVVNVRTFGGEAIDPGPFNIKSIRNIAGENHHYLLELKKIN